MEANYHPTGWPINCSVQQPTLNRRILGSPPPLFTQDSPPWGCPSFCPGFSPNCKALGPCKCCQPLTSYPTGQTQMFVPKHQIGKSHGVENEAEELSFLLNAKTTPPVLETQTSPRIKELHQRNWCVTSSSLSATSDRRLKVVKATHECLIPGCGKTYKRASHLKAHLRWHGNPAPFKCKWSTCGKRFSSQSKLEEHKKTHKDTC